MTQQTKTRVGIIGAGGIVAKAHLPGLLQESARAEVVLVAGRKESRLRALGDRFGVRGFTHRYEDVLADDRVDAVLIATPHPLHVEWGLEALAAGKHVFVEKPLAANMAEADAFVGAADAAARHGRAVFCMPHFPDAVHTVRRRLGEGAIGQVSAGRARTSHGGPEVYYREVAELFGEGEPADLWFFDAERAGGVGALFDMGVYAVAHMVALLGRMRRVTAMIATLDKPTTLEDTATVVMEAQSGALATAETGWCDAGRTWAFSVHGTGGKYEIGDDDDTARHIEPSALDRDDAPVRQTAVEPAVKVGSPHAHWLDCIERGVQPPLSNAHAARHVTEILLAALESAKSGRAVAIHSSPAAA